MKKRVLSILSIVAMLVAMLATIAVPAMADPAPDILEYDAENPQTAYQIKDVAGWKKFSELVNSGMNTQGVTFTLTNDLDFNGVTDVATVSGTNVANAFKGTLDGNGKTIKNLTMSNSAGLFRYVQSSTYKNLTLDTVNITWTGKYGSAFVGQLLENAVVEIDNVDLVNCTYTSGSNGEGVLVGCAEKATLTVKNCDLLNSVMNYTNSGTAYNGGFMVGTANTGTDSTSHFLTVENSSIIGCTMSGKNKVSNVGWVCGLTEFVTLRNVILLNNTNALQSVGNKATLTGYTEKNGVSSINNVYVFNSGDWDYRGVDGTHNVAGLYTDLNTSYTQTKVTNAYEMAWMMNTLTDTFAVSEGKIVPDAVYPTRKVTFGDVICYTEADGLVTEVPAAEEGFEWIFDATVPVTADTVVESRALDVENDINGDKIFNSADITALLQSCNGNAVEIDTAKADINGDGKITLADALKLLKKLNA